MIVGLTGGIASGKSLVASFLWERGVPIIDTDEIARQVVAPEQPAWRRLREWLGANYFLPDGALDRAAVARYVFAEPDARRRLEAITHPAIFAEVDRRIDLLRRASAAPDLIVVVVPLLFEVGAEHRFDAVMVVWATPEQQRERLRRDRHLTAEEADARIAVQYPLADKLARADYRIDNSGSREDTNARVDAVLRQLRGR
jgi:dephospho-CoA kinase